MVSAVGLLAIYIFGMTLIAQGNPMTEAQWTQFLLMLTAAGVFLGPIITSLHNDYRARRLARDLDAAEQKRIAQLEALEKKQAAALEKVETTLAETNRETKGQLNAIEKTGEMTHTLVNSEHGKALESNLELATLVVTLRGNENDIATAEQARRVLGEHQDKQATVDAGVKTSDTPPRPGPQIVEHAWELRKKTPQT